MQTFKVVHRKDNVETVYLVTAESKRQAQTLVLDTLYERNHPVDPPYTAAELDRDPFGLKQHTMDHGVDWSDAALCKRNGCTIGATPWSAEVPYRLYALDLRTGAMT